MVNRTGVNVKFEDNTKAFARRTRDNMMSAMTDVTLDLKRVASASAPHKSGYLSKNAQHDVFISSKYVEGTVGFSAMEDGFNYAEWTHNESYNLGKKSQRKTGGKSKYGSGTVPVGKGYLANSLRNNRKGYMDYLQDTYSKSLKGRG